MLCFAQFMHAEMFPDMTIFECKDCAMKYKCDLPMKDEIVLTNADRIRAMTDEELAEFISKLSPSFIRFTVKAAWLDWLKQGVDE